MAKVDNDASSADEDSIRNSKITLRCAGFAKLGVMRKFGLTRSNFETCADATESSVEIQNSLADKFNSFNEGTVADHPAFFGSLKNIMSWKYNSTKTYDVQKECLDPYKADADDTDFPESNFERIYMCACMGRATCEIPYMDA